MVALVSGLCCSHKSAPVAFGQLDMKLRPQCLLSRGEPQKTVDEAFKELLGVVLDHELTMS